MAAAAASTTRREAARGLLAGRRVSRHVRRQRHSSCSSSKSSHSADRSRTSGNRLQWRHTPTTMKHAHNRRSSTSPERRHGRSSSEKPNDYSCDDDAAAAGERELWVTDSTHRLLHGAHKLRARKISTSGRKRIRGKFRNASQVERRSNRS